MQDTEQGFKPTDTNADQTLFTEDLQPNPDITGVRVLPPEARAALGAVREQLAQHSKDSTYSQEAHDRTIARQHELTAQRYFANQR